MLDGPQVFVDIDTQRDFLEPNGALFVPGSDLIVPNLARLTKYALEHRIPVLATACATRLTTRNSGNSGLTASLERAGKSASRPRFATTATSWAASKRWKAIYRRT